MFRIIGIVIFTSVLYEFASSTWYNAMVHETYELF